MNKFFIVLVIIVIFFRQIILLNAENETYINTQNITYDETKDILELSGDSKINLNDVNILVDRGIIDYKNNKVEIFGNFYLYQDLNILSGKDLVGDTSLNNYSAIDVSYIYNDDLKIDSKKSKKSDNLIYFYNNFLTPCELEGYFGCPTWSLRIDETVYDIEKDKFVHFDTFLQVADYKLFYLPYFSHYGSKAPRKKGFLTPTLEFKIGGNSGIYTPYYIPIKENTEIKLTPKFIFSQSLDFVDNYSLNTQLNHKASGGNFNLNIDTIKYEDNSNVNSSAKLKLRQVLSKNKVFYFEGLVTNSKSTTRSLNDEPVKFEDIYLRLDNFNFFLESDYLRAEISTVETFDATNESFIPYSPMITYHNKFNLGKNILNNNEVIYTVIKRDRSKINLASESNNFKINNYFSYNNRLKNFNIFNRLTLLNGLNSYFFEHDDNLNSTEGFNHLILSSDYFFKLNRNFKPRIKIIYNQDIQHSDNILNEDSNTITYNYQNLFSDNRFFGSDLKDNTTRVVYGFESNFGIKNQIIKFNSGQSYDFKKSNNFNNKLNQNSPFSDYAIEANTKIKGLNLSLDARLDRETLKKKELNLSLNTDIPVNITLNYHETSKNAFSEKSNDTEYLGINLEKNINDNLVLSYGSNIDLRNNFNPYYDTFGIKILDECSQLNIQYSNKRYSDNYNTSPEELISISFYMDYLGFFGYEQTTDLFFQETGTFNYGL